MVEKQPKRMLGATKINKNWRKKKKTKGDGKTSKTTSKWDKINIKTTE